MQDAWVNRILRGLVFGGVEEPTPMMNLPLMIRAVDEQASTLVNDPSWRAAVPEFSDPEKLWSAIKRHGDWARAAQSMLDALQVGPCIETAMAEFDAAIEATRAEMQRRAHADTEPQALTSIEPRVGYGGHVMIGFGEIEPTTMLPVIADPLDVEYDGRSLRDLLVVDEARR